MTEQQEKEPARNVLGLPLATCGCAPMTGFYRDGRCETGPDDRGEHVVCAVMTEEFLKFSKAHGNDLSTPRPEYDFEGLKPGNRWCLCLDRWIQAYEAGFAAQVVLEATHESALRSVSLEVLTEYAVSHRA